MDVKWWVGTIVALGAMMAAWLAVPVDTLQRIGLAKSDGNSLHIISARVAVPSMVDRKCDGIDPVRRLCEKKSHCEFDASVFLLCGIPELAHHEIHTININVECGQDSRSLNEIKRYALTCNQNGLDVK